GLAPPAVPHPTFPLDKPTIVPLSQSCALKKARDHPFEHGAIRQKIRACTGIPLAIAFLPHSPKVKTVKNAQSLLAIRLFPALVLFAPALSTGRKRRLQRPVPRKI